MERRILVLGGTGLLGEPVARRLRSDGFRVRVLSRDPGKAGERLDESFELVAGDVEQPDTLEPAFADCWGVHVSLAGPSEQTGVEASAALAADLGLSRIGYVSGSTVDERHRWFPMVEGKLRAERAVEASGVPWTIFRPTWVFETLARFVRRGRATVVGRHPTPYHWFAAGDFARMVSAAYRSDDAAGRRFYIHGPEAISMHDALNRYRRVLHPEIDAVSSMPTWLAKGLAVMARNEPLRAASEMMAYFDRVGELGDPTEADRLLGAPTTTLGEWLEERKRARWESPIAP